MTLELCILAAIAGIVASAAIAGAALLRIAFIPAIAASAAAVLATAAPAYADQQGFLNFIHSQGVPSSYFTTPGADYSNIKVAEMVCQVFHNGGTAADIPFLGFQQDAYRGVLIEGAQRFMCPDTLH